MPEYTARGRVVLENVLFTIQAPTMKEAQAMARAGDFRSWEPQSGALAAWQINDQSIEGEEDDDDQGD